MTIYDLGYNTEIENYILESTLSDFTVGRVLRNTGSDILYQPATTNMMLR